MSLQWTFIASCLYVEIGLTVILLLPFISATRWQSFFRSRLIQRITAYGHIYFNVFIAILALLFVDAIRETKKHTFTDDSNVNITAEARMMAQMKLFRAQRNFYIAGFALFLFFVVKRLIKLTSSTATLTAQCIASQKQAEGANEAARRLMEDKENKANRTKEEEKKAKLSETDEDLLKDLKQTQQELEKTKDELNHARLDLDSMKKQATSTNAEYDRLLKEHAVLQEKLEKLESEVGKKDK